MKRGDGTAGVRTPGRIWWLLVGLALGSAAPAASQSQDETLLRLGVMIEVPTEPDRLLRLYGDLIGVLRKRLAAQRIHVPDILIARDIEDLSQRLVAGEADFIIETAFPSLLLQQRSRRLEPSLVVVRRGRREYKSVFFTRRGASIRSLEDLRGRTLVLQAPRSTSAFAMPRVELARHGIAMVPADAAGADARAVRYALAGAEINQAIWVLHDRGDAGAFNDGDWDALPARVRDELRVFHETRPMLRALLSVRSGLKPRARKALEDLLLALPNDREGRAALATATGITGFERLTPQDLEGLRAWEAALGRFGTLP
jgi:phosphonate transport system substrate-binding protein